MFHVEPRAPMAWSWAVMAWIDPGGWPTRFHVEPPGAMLTAGLPVVTVNVRLSWLGLLGRKRVRISRPIIR